MKVKIDFFYAISSDERVFLCDEVSNEGNLHTQRPHLLSSVDKPRKCIKQSYTAKQREAHQLLRSIALCDIHGLCKLLHECGDGEDTRWHTILIQLFHGNSDPAIQAMMKLYAAAFPSLFMFISKQLLLRKSVSLAAIYCWQARPLIQLVMGDLKVCL